MRKVKTDNSDLIEYVNTVKELKNHIPIEEYEMNIVNCVLMIFHWLRRKNLNLPIPKFAGWKKRENLLLNTLLTS